MSDRSLSSLLGFLDYLASKGLMARNTVVGRRAACSKVFGILAPEEQTDITQVDIEEAMTRFINLEGKGYTPSSLTVYKSRVTSAVSDFEAYLANPSGFKPSATLKKSGQTVSKNSNEKKPSKETTQRAEPTRQPEPTVQTSANVFPVPIRADVVVRIHGLPFDLTPAEAEKIASVVKAMAMKTD